MKERPILFSGAMVRALLAGTKTQTRRVVKPQPAPYQQPRTVIGSSGFVYVMDNAPLLPYPEVRRVRWDCPYGQPGDRLWVRETWRIGSWDDGCGFWIDYRDGPRKERLECPDVDLAYRLIEQTGEDLRKCNIQPTNGTMYEWTPGQSPLRWRPSIHMPRWASRITLEITGVRVERLQDISEADAKAEGIFPHVRGGWHWLKHDSGNPNEWNQFGYKTAALAFQALWESINGTDSWAANPWVWTVEFRRLP